MPSVPSVPSVPSAESMSFTPFQEALNLLSELVKPDIHAYNWPYTTRERHVRARIRPYLCHYSRHL